VLALADDALTPALRRRVIAHIAVAGRHIERHLSTWFSPNTHLTGEALGLFAIGTALPQCLDAARWKELGAAILLEWVDRHVRHDGSYVEQSTWYHRYTTDFYLQFLVLAERSGMSVRGRLERSLNGLLEYLLWITRPDGSMPLIGDDDGQASSGDPAGAGRRDRFNKGNRSAAHATLVAGCHGCYDDFPERVEWRASTGSQRPTFGEGSRSDSLSTSRVRRGTRLPLENAS